LPHRNQANAPDDICAMRRLVEQRKMRITQSCATPHPIDMIIIICTRVLWPCQGQGDRRPDETIA
jgi:hypothetical protein